MDRVAAVHLPTTEFAETAEEGGFAPSTVVS
jgi:hypothetical protein